MADDIIFLLPRDIRFTHSSISRYFGDGTPLTETLDDLLQRRIKKRHIPLMEVVYRYNRWWSLDNRRLWVFKELWRRGGCNKIKVRQVYVNDAKWSKKFTTQNDGTSVILRSNYHRNYSTFPDTYMDSMMAQFSDWRL